MAITFDDLPFAYSGQLTMAEQREAVTRVLATLDKHRVTATVFVIGRSVTDANRGLVDAVARAGHFVGSQLLPPGSGLQGAGHLDAIKPTAR